MPTYEYACRTCGHHFEAWQHMSDEPLKVCPECGAEIHRVLYPAGIVFKGSGFYKTDNGSSSRVEKSSATESKAEGKTESKTESGASKSSGESGKSDSSGSSPSPASAAAD